MLACLFDVHGNLLALEAVLADAEAAGASSFLHGGDYAAFGAWPEECVARLRERPAAGWVRGNWERWTARPEDMPEDAVLRRVAAVYSEILGEEDVASLAGLPFEVRLDDALFVHGSPASDEESFVPEPGDDDERMLGGVSTARRVVFGHFHLQFTRPGPGGVELVGPGSVGMPFDGDPRAAYALIHDDGRVEPRRVEYDADASAAALLERFGDEEWAARTAKGLRVARFS